MTDITTIMIAKARTRTNDLRRYSANMGRLAALFREEDMASTANALCALAAGYDAAANTLHLACNELSAGTTEPALPDRQLYARE